MRGAVYKTLDRGLLERVGPYGLRRRMMQRGKELDAGRRKTRRVLLIVLVGVVVLLVGV